MKIFLDTADLDMIRPAYETGLIDGVTTNPTLILRSGRDLREVAEELSGLPMLESISTEVVGDTMGDMLRQAQQFVSISSAITIKVPCTVEGLKACRVLNVEGVKTNVTLVFTVAQAILAAKAGATYISPFIGRWEDNSVDGIDLIQKINRVYHRFFVSGQHVPQILGASIRDVRQVEKCAEYGADVVTIPPIVFWKMYKNIMTDKGLDQFQRDWEDANK